MRFGPAGLLLISGLTAAGCAPAGPPRIALGARCAACSMEVGDLRYACERRVDHAWRTYDSIECLIQDAAKSPGADVHLTDYDARALRPADSLWVVKGEFPSPMGGGFAAFASRAAAESVAAGTHGAVDRFVAWVARGWP